MLRPRLPRHSRALVALVALAALLGATAPAALANGGPVANPYSPAYGHPYRHGVVPTIARQKQMDAWARSGGHFGPPSKQLSYGGGIDGIGVTTGPEQVYLVFWGSQWGTMGTDASGYTTLSGDPSSEAPYLQGLIDGLGTSNELWSGVMTQYCDGVTSGAQSCPAGNTQHVAYPNGGALAGVWVDESTASPSQATAAQLGQEAVSAAGHFGNTSPDSNRNAQYVILSPTGTNPDGFNTPSGGFCAWHDWNGDPYVGVSSTYGDIAFTNMPYVTDMGASCGQNFVNSGSTGTLDGVSIVEGHEYAETITDQNPAGGWTDSSGYENGDKCAWISPGSSGGAFNLVLGNVSYAMQTTWANDGNTCEASHAIVPNGTATAPTVSSISPTSGPATGGTSVTVSGSGFTDATAVDFGGNAASFTITSDTQISATSPAGSGTVDITVTTPNGTSTTGSSDQFIYVTATTSPTINTTSLPAAHVGRSYSATLTASGGDGSYMWGLQAGSSLPTSFTLDTTTGTISSPNVSASNGKYTFTVAVTDGTGGTASQSLTLNVVGH